MLTTPDRQKEDNIQEQQKEFNSLYNAAKTGVFQKSRFLDWDIEVYDPEMKRTVDVFEKLAFENDINAIERLHQKARESDYRCEQQPLYFALNGAVQGGHQKLLNTLRGQIDEHGYYAHSDDLIYHAAFGGHFEFTQQLISQMTKLSLSRMSYPDKLATNKITCAYYQKAIEGAIDGEHLKNVLRFLKTYNAHHHVSYQTNADMLASILDLYGIPYKTDQKMVVYQNQKIKQNARTHIEFMIKHVLPAIENFQLRYYTTYLFMDRNKEVLFQQNKTKLGPAEVEKSLPHCIVQNNQTNPKKQRTEPFFDKTCTKINHLFDLLEEQEINGPNVLQDGQLTYTTRFDILKQLTLNAIDQYIQQQSWWWWLIFIFTGRRKYHMQRARSLRKACSKTQNEKTLIDLLEHQLYLFGLFSDLNIEENNLADSEKTKRLNWRPYDPSQLKKHEREVVNKNSEQDNFCQTIANTYHLIRGPNLLIAQDCAIHELSQYSKRWWIWNRAPAKQMIERSQWATSIDELREIIPCPQQAVS